MFFFFFFTLECLYFLCFGHSCFIIIDIDIAKMMSNFIFSGKIIVTDMKYIKSEIYYLFFFFSFFFLYMYRLTCFASLMFREYTFKVKLALLAVKKVQLYVTGCAKLFVHCFSAICVRQYCI